MIFTDSIGLVEVHIFSTWQSEKRKRHQACQTTPVEKKPEAIQASLTVRNVPTQTREAPTSLDNLSLQRLACRTEAVLIENGDSEADILLVPQSFYGLNDGDIELLFTLEPGSDDGNKTVPAQGHERQGLGSLVCTSLDWNATGTTLAAGYGRKDPVGWCDHPGALCTWNIEYQASDSYDMPSNTIMLDNCLMCLAFHPREPDIIAGGTFNGEIFVWDLKKDDPQIAVSGATHICHSEPITQVVWYFGGKENCTCSSVRDTFQIVSTSTDGQILLWSGSNLDGPLYGYAILYPRAHSSKAQQWGGTCMDLPSDPDHHSTLIVGTEGGTVYRCDLEQNQKSMMDFRSQGDSSGLLSNSCRTGKIKLSSPVKAQYESHVGPVHCVKVSPFDDRVFMTCGYDGFVSMYNTSQVKPIIKLEPSELHIFCLRWSPFRPLVIAVGAGGGQVFLFDLQRSMLHPTTALDVSDKGNPVFALAFNHLKRQYFACSDGLHVKVYLLGLNYTKERMSERQQLARLAQSAVGHFQIHA